MDIKKALKEVHEAAARRNAVMVKLRDEGSTLQEIGDMFNLTRERVRQILKRSSSPDRQQ